MLSMNGYRIDIVERKGECAIMKKRLSRIICVLLTCMIVFSSIAVVPVNADQKKGKPTIAGGEDRKIFKYVLYEDGTLKAWANGWYLLSQHRAKVKKVILEKGVTVIDGCKDFKNMTEIAIQGKPTVIKSYAFRDCVKLTKFSVPSTVTKIESSAFAGCTRLKSVNLSSKLTTIEKYAFEKCKALSYIKFPKTIKTIEKYAFSECSALKTIRFLGVPTKIGDYAFYKVKANGYYPAGVSTSALKTGNKHGLTGYLGYINWFMVANKRRLAGGDRYGTAFEIANGFKKDIGKSRVDNVIIVRGDNFPDALSAGVLAKKYNAPILLTSKGNESKVKDWIKKNVKSGGRVIAVGGNLVVPGSQLSGLSGFSVSRVSGNDRYGTNLQALKQITIKSTDEILVADGDDWKNALIASATGRPLLLVAKGGLTKAQKDFLSGKKFKKFLVVGSAVSTKAFNDLNAIKKAERLTATSTDAMSVKIAKRYWKSGPKQAFLAINTNYPDALSGGAICIANNSPLFLIDNKNYGNTKSYCRGLKITRVTMLGGHLCISDATANAIAKIG